MTHRDHDRSVYPPLDRLKPVAPDLWIVDSGPLHLAGVVEGLPEASARARRLSNHWMIATLTRKLLNMLAPSMKRPKHCPSRRRPPCHS